MRAYVRYRCGYYLRLSVGDGAHLLQFKSLESVRKGKKTTISPLWRFAYIFMQGARSARIDVAYEETRLALTRKVVVFTLHWRGGRM